MMRMARIMTIFVLLAVNLPAKADLSDGLVAHWEFDEGTGSTAYDSAGDNDGTVNGPLWTSGQIDGALNFDGSNDRVEIGDKFNDLAVPFSISTWIRKDSNGVMGLFRSDDLETPSTGNYYGFWFFLNDQEVEISYGDGSGSGPPERRTKKSGPVIENDQWTMVTAVVNGPTDMSLYVDGIDVGGTYSGTGGDMVHNSRNARIGLVTTSLGYFPFDGSIDDVRIYNRALSAEEIEQLYTGQVDPLDQIVEQIREAIFEKLDAAETIYSALAKELAAYEALEQILEDGDYGDLKKGDLIKARQKVHSATQHQDQAIHQIEESIEKLKDALKALGLGPPVPVSHWKFDEGTGSTAYDSAGSNDGTIYGDTAWVTGQIGGALDFDGDGDHVVIPDDDSLTPSSEITIAFWLFNRAEQPAGIYKYAACPSEPASPGNSRSYLMTVYDSSGKASLKVYSSVDDYGRITSNNVVPLNEWHHLVATFDQGNAAIYIDGQLDNSATLSVSSIMNDAQPLIIGGFWDYCGTDAFHTSLNGMMDDVRIYDRALSDIEVQLLYYNALD